MPTLQVQNLDLAAFINAQGGRLLSCDALSSHKVCWKFEDNDIARQALRDYENAHADGAVVVAFSEARARLLAQSRRVLNSGFKSREVDSLDFSTTRK